MSYESRTSDVWSPALELAQRIASARTELLDALSAVATAASAQDEVARAVATMAGVPWELAINRPPRVRRVASFLPSNNVLYSYILFALIPSLYSDSVMVRPSTRVKKATQLIHQILSDCCDIGACGEIEWCDESQRVFTGRCEDADVVVFTGRHENGLDIASRLPGVPVLSHGSGPNPVVVTPSANVARASADALRARLYNVGQDCLCPDVFLVSRDVYDEFRDSLVELLAGLALGDRKDPEAVIAPLVYDDAFEFAAGFIASSGDCVTFGGEVDASSRVIMPTIVEMRRLQDFHPPEFFSPIFCLVPYSTEDEVARWIETPREQARGMYVSVYGESTIGNARVAGTSVVCHDRTGFDGETGNAAFGGYGPEASCVFEDGHLTGQPLLLSEFLASRSVD